MKISKFEISVEMFLSLFVEGHTFAHKVKQGLGKDVKLFHYHLDRHRNVFVFWCYDDVKGIEVPEGALLRDIPSTMIEMEQLVKETKE